MKTKASPVSHSLTACAEPKILGDGCFVVDFIGNLAACRCCGSQKAIPTVEDERILGLFESENISRQRGEYDKASAISSAIVSYLGAHLETHSGKRFSLMTNRPNVIFVGELSSFGNY